MDHSKVMDFLGKFVTDLGAAEAAGSIAIGDRLGLYSALGEGPATPEQFAVRTGCHVRYVAEWLRGQAAGGFTTYDPATGEFSLTEEQAFCLAHPNGPHLPSAFRAAVAALRAVPQIADAFRTGEGVGWHEHDSDVFLGIDAFYRTGYATDLVPNWIPALDGVEAKLAAGARVADVGCGFGTSTVLVAQAYPQSTLIGSDYHAESIEHAAKAAAEAGVGDRVSFEVATAQSFSGTGYDLVMMFDALHDLGDPVGAARRVFDSLAADGTWLLVEPYAADTLEDNFNPVGRLYYSGSLLMCVPNAMSQGGHALGAQAGPAATRDVVTTAGFTQFRVVAQTPFNLVYEIRP